MNGYFEILGHEVKDLITEYSGIATTVAFDLYGCVQVLVTPPLVEGKPQDSHWFDHKRLAIMSLKPRMAPPSFATHTPGIENGPEAKPGKASLPSRRPFQ